MERKDIEGVIRKYPKLANYGIGADLSLPPAERRRKFLEDQEALLRNTEQIERACIWWTRRKKRKSINHEYASYSLKKNLAEREIGYVTNGAFIAAAVICGFDIELIPHNPNVYFNVSSKSLKAVGETLYPFF